MVLYGAVCSDSRQGARALLALAAEEHWGFSALPDIGTLPQGKPVFSRCPEHEFNLSHSGPLALAGLDRLPLGVDIQLVRDFLPRLPLRTCSPAELAWLDRQPDRNAAFAQLWALKECRVKESGTGLRVPLREIRIPLPVPSDGAAAALDGLLFRTYRGEDWAAAVCGHTEPPASILWRSPGEI